jgi:hypothetical protein
VPQSRRAGCRGFDSPVGEEVSPLRADRLKVERAVGSPNGPPGRFFPACSGLALLAAGAGGTAPPPDYAAVALNVLPPGESGDLRFPPTASDQPPLYDGLTPHATVTARDLTRYFKSERFGVTGKVVRVERPRPGVRIPRDRWDVPHVYGKTLGGRRVRHRLRVARVRAARRAHSRNRADRRRHHQLAGDRLGRRNAARRLRRAAPQAPGRLERARGASPRSDGRRQDRRPRRRSWTRPGRRSPTR